MFDCLFTMTANGLQLQEVGNFEALNCLSALNLIQSTKLHLPLNRQFLVAAVSGSLFFVKSVNCQCMLFILLNLLTPANFIS